MDKNMLLGFTRENFRDSEWKRPYSVYRSSIPRITRYRPPQSKNVTVSAMCGALTLMDSQRWDSCVCVGGVVGRNLWWVHVTFDPDITFFIPIRDPISSCDPFLFDLHLFLLWLLSDHVFRRLQCCRVCER